jgi:Putative zinc-finger
MSCTFAEWDGAYVLGSLSPADRLAFEQHLSGCADCARGVRELAGMPGLLSRVRPDVLENAGVVDPVPDTLLPSLVHKVRRTQRRRVLASAAGIAAAAVVAVVALTVGGDDAGPPPASVPAAGRAMLPLGGAPVHATVALESVTWGTRLDLTCTYESSDYAAPDSVTYAVVVRTRDGGTEQVGTWKSVQGKTMRLTAATAASRADIASVEVRTTEGKPVLRLAG